MRSKRRRRLTAVAALIASLTLSASSADAHPTPVGPRGLPSDSTAQELVAPGDGFNKSDAGIMAGTAVAIGLGAAMARTRLRPKPAMHT
jgi:hypothetical protein